MIDGEELYLFVVYGRSVIGSQQPLPALLFD